MDPLLATGAVSLASQLIRNLTAPKEPKPQELAPAQQARFSELLARASKSPQVQAAQFLDERGLHSAREAEQRIEQLSTQLLQTPELQSFVAGSGNSVSMQVNPDGGVTVRTTDGRERTFSLQADERKLASELQTIGSALQMEGGAQGGRAGGAVTIRVTPGAGVSLERVTLR